MWGRGEPTYHNSALFIRQVCVGVTASNQYFLLQDWFIICFVASLLAWEYLQLKNVLIKLVIILLCEKLHDSFIISCTEATKILKKVWCILIVLFGKAECPVCLVGKCWRHADNLSNRPCVGESIWGHSLPQKSKSFVCWDETFPLSPSFMFIMARSSLSFCARVLKNSRMKQLCNSPDCTWKVLVGFPKIVGFYPHLLIISTNLLFFS